MIADLHVHTTASDGKQTPAQAAEWAFNSKIEVLSVTDHDSVSGLEEAEAEAKRLGIKFVRGIEISTISYCEVHVLGYNIDYKDPDFASELDRIKDMRRMRNAEIGKKLKEYGVMPDMDFEAQGVGRMNIAREMVKAGYVKDVTEAFDKYLGLGAKAYCTPKRITPKQAVELIVKYGGFASLAHPKRYLLDNRLEKLLGELVPAGLNGLEVNYPGHSDADKTALKAMCKKCGLLPTGGSDHHGDEDKKFAFELDFRTAKALNIL